ncbi:hypothetical protein ACROYT_G013559 [Oculina patagonica]
MLWQKNLTLAFGALVLVTLPEASNSTVTIRNGTSECVPAPVHTKAGVCTPYQVAFPKGYCKDIIGYLPVYGTHQFELHLNEIKLLLFQKFLERSRANSTEEGWQIITNDKSFAVRQSCLDMVDDVYCHHYFKRCYISSRPQVICREACEELFFQVCDREHEMVKTLNFDIIDCTTLPFRNQSSNCYYPDKIREKLNVLDSKDCFYGDGRGYHGNRSVTVSGYTCQSWNAQCPHKHNINGKIYKSFEQSGNLCRNPGGYALHGPWCFTTDRTVRWEYCDVPKCAERPPSSPPINFRGHNMSSTSIKLTWGDVPKDLIHGILLGFHVVCKRLKTSDSPFADLLPAEHEWVFEGLQKYRNYSCRLRAYNNYGNGTWSEELDISTDDDVPDAPPESLKAWNLSSTSLRVQWDPIPFGHRNGKIIRYKVDINAENQTWERLKATKYTESTSLTLTGLQKYSKYVISVSGITRRGKGPLRSKTVQTDEDVPDAPPESLMAWNLSSTSLHVQWDPIPFRHRNGKILRYKVDISDWKRLKVTKYTEMTSFTLKGLKKYSKYKISVSGMTRRGKGPPLSKMVQTDEDVPYRPPENITAVSIGTDTVQVDWSSVPSEYTNGEVLGYKVLYRDVNDSSRVNISLASPNETHSKIKGLKVNTNYSFQVLAFTAKGNGLKSMAYYARTFPDLTNKETVDPSIEQGEVHSAKVSTIVIAAVFSGTVAFGSVFLVVYLVRKKRISSNSDSGNGLGCSVTPYVISTPDLLNERYKRLQPRDRRRLLKGAVDGVRNPLYDGILRVISPTAAFQGNKCRQDVQTRATANMEDKQHLSVDLGELRGFVEALQGYACGMEMAKVETVKQRCQRRFSVDMGQVRELIALGEMKIS